MTLSRAAFASFLVVLLAFAAPHAAAEEPPRSLDTFTGRAVDANGNAVADLELQVTTYTYQVTTVAAGQRATGWQHRTAVRPLSEDPMSSPETVAKRRLRTDHQGRFEIALPPTGQFHRVEMASPGASIAIPLFVSPRGARWRHHTLHIVPAMAVTLRVRGPEDKPLRARVRMRDARPEGKDRIAWSDMTVHEADAAGVVRFHAPAAADLQATVYVAERLQANRIPVRPDPTGVATIRIPEGSARVAVRVTDRNSEPLQDAVVLLHIPIAKAGGAGAEYRIAEVTDASGRATFTSLPDAILRGLDVWRPGHHRVDHPRRIAVPLRPDLPHDIEIVMDRDVDVRGRVRDRQGRWIAGAGVRAVRQQHAASAGFAATITDAEGRFHLQGLRPGRYTIEARSDEHYSLIPMHLGSPRGADTPTPKAIANQQLELPTEEQPELALEVGASVAGQLVDSEGRPMADKRLVLQPDRLAPTPGYRIAPSFWTTVTDSEGRFRVGGLPPLAQLRLQSFQVVVPEDQALLLLGPAGTTTTMRLEATHQRKVSGVVVDGQGEPVAGVLVRVGPQLVGRTDGRGTFSVIFQNAFPGPIEVALPCDVEGAHGVTVPAGTVEATVRLVLPPTQKTLTVTVRGTGDAPLPRRQIVVRAPELGPSAAFTWHATTNASGVATIPYLPMAPLDIEVAGEAERIAAEVTRHEVRLPIAAPEPQPPQQVYTVRGWITDGEGKPVPRAQVRLTGAPRAHSAEVWWGAFELMLTGPEPPGPMTLRVSRIQDLRGARSVMRPTTVPVNVQQQLTRVRVALSTGSTRRIRLTNEDGAALAGLPLKLQVERPKGAPRASRFLSLVAQSDDDGWCTFVGLPEDATARAHFQGHADWAPLPPVDLGSSTTYRLMISPWRTVRGQVLDDDGQIIPHARIVVNPRSRRTRAPSGGEHRVLESDAEGRFEIPRVAPQRPLELLVTARPEESSRYFLSRRTLPPPHAKSPSVTLQLAKVRSLSGRLIDQFDAPLANGNVHLLPWFLDDPQDRMRDRHDLSKDTGRFHFAQLRRGSYRLIVYRPGGDVAIDQRVEVPAAPLSVIVQRQSLLRVQLPDGTRPTLEGWYPDGDEDPVRGNLRKARTQMVPGSLSVFGLGWGRGTLLLRTRDRRVALLENIAGEGGPHAPTFMEPVSLRALWDEKAPDQIRRAFSLWLVRGPYRVAASRRGKGFLAQDLPPGEYHLELKGPQDRIHGTLAFPEKVHTGGEAVVIRYLAPGDDGR